MNNINQIIETLDVIPKLEKNKDIFFNEFFNLGIIGVIETKLHEGKYLFRSRINEDNSSFLSQEKISYPPTPSKYFGRAHCPKGNMFYGSFTPSYSSKDEIRHAYIINAYEICTFLRDKKSKGEKRITIGKWRVKNSIRLATIIFHDKLQNKTVLSQNLNFNFNNNLQSFPQFSQDTNIWNKFISQEFAKEVNKSNSSEYIISATYSEFLLNKGFDGIIYPTVCLDGRGFNIAIATNVVDTSLELEIVGEGRFYKDELQTILDLEKICIVDNPNDFKYKDDPEKIGAELCLKIIAENKAKAAN